MDCGRLARLGTSPIVNLHVVYDRRVLELPFAAGVDTPVQWVFDRTAGAGLARGSVPGRLAVGRRRGAGHDGRRAARPVHPALAELLPAAGEATVSRRSSSPASTPRRSVPRPERAPCALAREPRSPDCVLAGAWTDTGWPATMEGAVRSGRAAARGARNARAQGPAETVVGGMSGLTVLAPLSIEARAVRAGAPWARVQRIGMGPRRAARARTRGRRRRRF